MMESKEIEKDDKVEKVVKNPAFEELSETYSLLFKILLIIQIIIFIVMFIFFGLNHLILFVVSTTVTIRLLLGIHYKRPNYYNASLFLFILLFVSYIIKIVFRFILTFLIFENRDNIGNLQDMNIIKTENILWIKGFDIKINGLWTIIILSIFMLFWLFVIILLSKKQNCFEYFDNTGNEEYTKLIDEFYKPVTVQLNLEENK